MKISRLIQKRIKVCVMLDTGDNIYLRYDTVLKFGLKKNDELTEVLLNKIYAEDHRLHIKEISFRLLTRRMHSASELKRKLLSKKFPPERIEEAVNELIDRQYLDDEKFAEKYAEEKLKNSKTGLIKIKAELIAKGVDKRIIEKVLLKMDNSEILLKNALLLSKKKISTSQFKSIPPKKQNEKLFRFLISKGYQGEVIKSALKKLNLTDQTDESFD